MIPSSSLDGFLLSKLSPYVAPLLKNTKFARARFASSIIIAVVSTFALNASIGSSSVSFTPEYAAQWIIPSIVLNTFESSSASKSSSKSSSFFLFLFRNSLSIIESSIPSEMSRSMNTNLLLPICINRFKFALLSSFLYGPFSTSNTSMPIIVTNSLSLSSLSSSFLLSSR